jgi:hypothetical protein
MASKPSILITRGHGTTGDTGAFAGNISEEAHNKRIVPTIAHMLRTAGYTVTTFPADPTQDAPGTLDDEGLFAHNWMAALGGADGVMIDCHLESSSASGIFAIVPNLAHLITGAGVPQLPQDQWANNVGDRKLGKAICEEINLRTGIPIRTGFVREPGLMSEDMTFVGTGGGGAHLPSRLAMFGYTSPFCDSVYRLVVEFGTLQHDAAFFTRADFPARCGEGIVAAFGRVFEQAQVIVQPQFDVDPIPEKVVRAFGGAIVRDRPELTARVKVSYRKPTALRIVGKARGDEAANSTEWYLIKSKGPSNKGFIHISGLDRRETA